MVEELSKGLRPQRSNSLVMLPSLGASRECRAPASDANKRMRSEGSGERLCMHCHVRLSPSWPPVALCSVQRIPSIPSKASTVAAMDLV